MANGLYCKESSELFGINFLNKNAVVKALGINLLSNSFNCMYE